MKKYKLNCINLGFRWKTLLSKVIQASIINKKFNLNSKNLKNILLWEFS